MNAFRYQRWRERIGGTGAGWPARRRAGRERDPLAAMYWRRRLVALALGLSVLAVIAWAFNGAIGGGTPSGTSAGSGGSGAGNAAGQQQDLGGGAGASSNSVSPRASSSSPAASASSSIPGSCPHGDVVLSLINAQPGYGRRQLPQFTVDVVATGPQTCSFNVGASHIALIIRSGSQRVWSSADCVQGAGDLVTDLQRGVPTVLPISWNRQPSAPGCQAQSGSVPDGTYTATAADGWLQSNTITFRIT
jgi:hypothetical protein